MKSRSVSKRQQYNKRSRKSIVKKNVRSKKTKRHSRKKSKTIKKIKKHKYGGGTNDNKSNKPKKSLICKTPFARFLKKCNKDKQTTSKESEETENTIQKGLNVVTPVVAMSKQPEKQYVEKEPVNQPEENIEEPVEEPVEQLEDEPVEQLEEEPVEQLEEEPVK
jgi:hypothetical protein